MQVQWDALEKKLKSFNNAIHKPDFKDAVTTAMPRTFLLGNGDIAAVSDGSATHKAYHIGKNDFWSCGDLKTNAVMDFDVRRVTTLRAGTLSFDSLTSRRHFCEQIDLVSASVQSVYDDVTITACCLVDCNAMVFTVLSKNKKALNLTLSVPDNAPEYPCAYIEADSAGYVQRSTADFAKNERSWTSAVALRLFDYGNDLKETAHTNSAIRYHIELAANTPNWLQNKDASFVNLRARGAFLVSASYSAKKRCVEQMEITSLVQNEIRIYNEFKKPIVLAENGEAVPYTKSADRHGREILCFAAVPNEAYRISEK